MASVIIVALCFIGAAIAGPHPPPISEECRKLFPSGPPSLKPSDCCDGLDKFIDCKTVFAKCDAECKGPDFCCKGNCLAREANLLKDGVFDKDSAVKALSAMGSDWASVANAATVDACISDAASKKEQMPSPPPGAPKCDNIEVGIITHCIQGKLFSGCPKPTEGKECDDARAFFTKCMTMPSPPKM